MASTSYQEIRDSLRQLYLDDPRPWLVGFSGGKDSSMVASLLFEAVLAVPVEQRKKEIGHWGEAILHLGARRAESSTRAQTMADRQTRNGLRRHPDLPRVWVSNPIEFLTTEEVWAYLLQTPNPWGGDNRALYKLYANASGGECPIQIDTSTPACGNSRFGCWTCTVVDRDKASEGLLASGDERMEHLIAFRETLSEYRDPTNGNRETTDA